MDAVKLKLSDTHIKAFSTFDEMPIFTTSSSLKLLQGILAYGFTKPSPIQQKIIVPLAEGHDIIAQAQSGTGKTGAFTIGTLSRIDHKLEVPQAVIIVHTHELAEQVSAVIKEIGHSLGTKVITCIGKSSSVEDNMISLSKGAHVLIATPGRLNDLLDRKAFKPSAIKTVILDEADKLLSGNFRSQIGYILSTINATRESAELKDRLQIGVFSATYSNEIIDLITGFTCDPVVTLIPPEEVTLDGIKQYKIEVTDCPENPFKFKANIILAINQAKTIPQCIIYVNNINSANRLYEYLGRNEIETSVIHGKIPPAERQQITKDFRMGRSRILISTDLLARGFDSQHVMLVINFDLPRVLREKYTDGVCRLAVDEDRISEYIHRIGRSGRYGRKGVAINLITSHLEKTWMETIEEYYGVKSETLPEDLDGIF